MDDKTQIELEAAAFRTLVAHLRKRTDVQNIELMNLAGFCRNCLSKWYRAAAEEKGLDMDLEEARQLVYGMTYAEWKEHFQTEATPEQKAKYAEASTASDWPVSSVAGRSLRSAKAKCVWSWGDGRRINPKPASGRCHARRQACNIRAVLLFGASQLIELLKVEPEFPRCPKKCPAAVPCRR